MKSDDPSSPEFWDTRYLASRTPWDLGKIPERLSGFLDSGESVGAVLIPGCGTGYEIRAFDEAGFDVTALDFSAAAVQTAKQHLGPLCDRVIHGDFFTHALPVGYFDIVYERTFLCSFPPKLWPDFAKRVASLLKPGGKLIGIFVYGHEDEPPPYCLSSSEALDLFGEYFDCIEDEDIKDSLPLFCGMERWQEWLRK